MPLVKLSTGSVHYSEQGEGAPIVLLHANPGDSKDFEAVIPALARSNRVLALDWPGYGSSDIPPDPGLATVMTYYQVLREFITALALPPAFFIGNSIGGNVAARLAIELPHLVRGLVLVAPGGFTRHNLITRTFCRLQGSRLSLSPHRFASLYLKHRTPTAMAMLQRAATLQSTPERIALNRAMWRSFARPENDLREASHKIQVPTLLIFGNRDPAIPANKDGKVASQCIPSATFVALPCGHSSFAEIPEQFLALVQAFLNRCANA
jgi:pimeloyl-ACP methyl ester carboxylesterase